MCARDRDKKSSQVKTRAPHDKSAVWRHERLHRSMHCGRNLFLASLLLIAAHAASAASSCSSSCQPLASKPPNPLSISPTRGPSVGGQRLRVEGLGLTAVRGISLVVGGDTETMADE